MSSINPKENRDVIPNWRSYIKTARAGELYAMNSREVVLPVFPISTYVEAWNENRNIAFAGDLISAAILNEQTSLPEVIYAARFLVNCDEAPDLIKEMAQSILSSNLPDNYTASELSTSSIIEKIEQKKRFTIENISFIKQVNRNFPYNPIAYCELSRCYLTLGQYDKARMAMTTALHLAPYSRYISRCAARLFVHLNDLDIAHSIVVKNPAFKQDPWLIASEIAINTSMGRNSRFVNIGKKIISSQNYSLFSCSELSSAIGTLEMINGSRKNCIKFINQALVQPNDNSLAQAEWLAGENRDLRFVFKDYSDLHFKSEADARYAYACQKFNEAFKHAVNWLADSPYDRSSILFSSHIAYGFLKDYQSAIKILNIGLLSNPSDPIMLNNLAYVNALNGDVNEADILLNRIPKNSLDISIDAEICHIATAGLILFRKGDVEKGRNLYLEAINLARERATDRTLVNKAILNYIREELVARTCAISDVMDILSKIDANQDKEMARLREDVIDEVNRQSNIMIPNPIKFSLSPRK